MSLYSALRAGVSGLNSQTQAMSMIAENITNVNTTGYKAVRARFTSLVGSTSASGAFSAGVVNSRAQRAVINTGQITKSTTDTHLAVNGGGFFAVAKAEDVMLDRSSGKWVNRGEVLYTRAGDFSADANGNLKNSAGYVLLGWNRNNTNTGYDTSNLVSEFTAVNIAGTVGRPTPTQLITMNANLNASAKAGKSFSMTAPMYSRQGGISNIEFRFTKLGDGISQRQFRVESRITSGQAQMVNDNSTATATTNAASARVEVDKNGVPVTAGGTETALDLPFYGAQIGNTTSEIILNYGGKVGVNPKGDISNLKFAYTPVGGTRTEVAASAVAISGGQVKVTLANALPAGVSNLEMYVDPSVAAADHPLQFENDPSANPPVGISGGTSTPSRALTFPPIAAAGTPPTGSVSIQTYYDVGILSFDATGLNAKLSPPPAGSTQHRIGTISADGELNIKIDHAANGQAPSATGYDDSNVQVNFGRSGASTGMTSYESISTIYSIDQDGSSSGDLKSVTVNSQGEVQATFSRGTPRFLAQIPVTGFNNPNSLLVADGNAFRAADSAGIAVSRVAGSAGSGTISGGSLEASNADIATEFTEMIVVQRAYSASTKIITTSDEMLEDIIRAKR